LIGVGVLAVLAIVIAFVATRGGGESKNASSNSSTANASDLIALNVPAGWSVDAKGEVAAENAADLTAATPSGPRVRALVNAPADDPVALMSDALGQGDGDVVGDPDTASVSGQPAVQMTITRNGVEQRFLIAHPKGKVAIEFVLEAPADRFDATISVMETVPGLR
jgi:hypothetical protein